MRGFKDMIALLLENGSKVNALNQHGLAPLHIAAYWGYKDLFKFLLDKGADFDIKTGAGKSCVDIASERGQKELIELIAVIQKRRKMGA
jgi:ankyrin repeat protein